MQLIQSQQLTMSSREIAELVGSRHDNVRVAIERLAARGVIELPAMQEIPTATRPVSVYVFAGEKGKRDSIVVVAQLSPEFTARLVDRWQELEGKIANQKPVIENKLTGELALAECYARMLKTSQSSQALMIKKIGENNGLDTSFLPAYVIDASPDSGGGSSMPTKALTALIKDYGVSLSTKLFNAALCERGFIKQMTRTNGKRETVHYWAITEKGLEFGKNLTSPHSPRETQPHWYDEKFVELCGIIGVSASKVEAAQ